MRPELAEKVSYPGLVAKGLTLAILLVLFPQDPGGLLVEARGFFRDPLFGGVAVILADQSRKNFDCLLRPTNRVSTHLPNQDDLKLWQLQSLGPGQRSLVLNPEEGSLRYSLAPWERGPEIRWGDGWGAWEARCSQRLGSWLEWKSANGELHRSVIHVNREDPLTRLAWIEGVVPGETIQIRHRPLTLEYPMRSWTEWEEWAVPIPKQR